MASTVTLSVDPGEFNLMYGLNQVILQNLDPGASKYVLQVYIDGDKIADIRQSKNSANLAVFDIQNIIQSYTEPMRQEGIAAGFAQTRNRTVYYELKYGSETAGVVDLAENTQDFFVALPGRKNQFYYVQINAWQDKAFYDAGYRPNPENAACTDINDIGRILSDIEQRTGVVPDNITGRRTTGEYISERDVLITDKYSLSVFQHLNVTGQAIAGVEGCEAARIVAFNENGIELDDFTISNPYNDGNAGPDWVAYAVVGPANLGQNLPQGTKYYWVGFPLKNDVSCGGVHPGYTDQSGWGWHKFNIVESKCNDYDVLQVRWMNSFGFPDFFNFEKKNERKMSITRNTYLQESIQYNTFGGSDVRGTTTYSQDAEVVYTASTRFLTDEESKYLENLFVSPNVFVTFPAGTLQKDSPIEAPVTLLSKSYTTKTFRKDKLFQYEIQFKLAHGFKTQRG